MTGRMQNCAATCAALVWMAVAGAPAFAGSCTTSTTGLAFGNYQPLDFAGKLASSEVASTGTVTISCSAISAPASFTIALGPSGGSMSPRYMANPAGGAAMAYNVYRDATYTSIWGDGITGAMLSGTTPAGDSQSTFTVYGRIPAKQNTLLPGSFSAAVPVTLTYQP